MNRRTPILAVITAVVLAAVGLSPAHAALDDPVVSDLDSSLAGHVTGTVTSVAPYVTVRLSTEDEPVVLELAEGSATFDLSTVGLAGTLPILVASCEVAVQVLPEDCSTEIASAATFTPTDLVATVDPVSLTDSDPSAGVSVATNAAGTYELTWSLEQDGSPVAGQGGDAAGSLDENGDTAAFTVDGTDLLDGTYDLLVAITVTDPDVGAFPEATAQTTVTVNGAGPQVSATVGPIQRITRDNPASTVTVDTTRSGTYSLIWHLEQNGEPVVGVGSTEPLTGDLDPNGATSFALSGATLTDGDYDVVATITVTDPEIGTFAPVEAVGGVTVDKTGPAVDLSRSVGTIYPLIATKAFPTLSRIDVAGDPATITGFEVVSSGGTVVRELVLNVDKTVWNGRDSLGKVVVAATYAVYAVDADGNRNATGTLITVSRQTLVAKKFVKAVSASGSMFDRFIGKCSQLKIPSSRGVRGSLGYYANTKCGTQTFASSAVSTAHAIKVPAAAQYVSLRVNVTGGAAKAKTNSKGIVRYLNTKGAWTSETTISSPYGIHIGPTRSTTGLIDPNRFFVWGFVTAYGARYDVIRFTVVVNYYVLS